MSLKLTNNVPTEIEIEGTKYSLVPKEKLGDGIYIESLKELNEILDEWETELGITPFLNYDFPLIAWESKPGEICYSALEFPIYTKDSINEIPLEEFMPKIATKKVKKWEPKGGIFSITHIGTIETDHAFSGGAEFGVQYQTKEQAEKARGTMRKHNRLLAWLAENDDGFIDEGNATTAWYVYKTKDDTYYKDTNYGIRSLGKVYMSKHNAEKLCEALNSGEVEL